MSFTAIIWFIPIYHNIFLHGGHNAMQCLLQKTYLNCQNSCTDSKIRIKNLSSAHYLHESCCCILALNFLSFYCKLMFVHIVCKAIHAWNVSNIFYMCVSISDTNRGCNGFSYLIKFMTLHIWWTIYSQYDIAMIFENIRLTIYLIQ